MSDLLFILGILILIGTTFMINIYLGCYVVGILFILFGIIIENTKKQKE